MKKLIISFFILSWVSLSYAQTALDGLYFSQNYYGGTARFTAMGGAFAALGGDFSALSVNPASIGVTRGYELMITPSVTYNVTSASYLNNPITKNTHTHFGLDNLGISFGIFDNGDDIKLNMGIGYNKVSQNVSRISTTGYATNSSFARTLAETANGIESSKLSGNDAFSLFSWGTVLAWDTYVIDTLPGTTNRYIGITENLENGNIYLGGDLQQSYYNEVRGSTGEYLISIGGNIRDQFYFGFNFSMQSIWKSDYRSYTETAVNPYDFDTGFRSLSHLSEVTTRGTGYNIKLGVIWRPIAGLRWGAYFHSPTWTFLTDESSEYMTSDSDYYYGYNTAEHLPDNYDYKINTPIKWGTGLAYVIGSSAIISVEYEGQDYGATKMLERYGDHYIKMPYLGNESNLHYEDDYTRQNYGLVTNLRAGAEYRLNALSFRLGYTYYGSPVVDDNTFARSIFSAGLGFRTGVFYVDGAYAFSPNNEAAYTLYDSSPIADTDSYLGKISVTLGFRF